MRDDGPWRLGVGVFEDQALCGKAVEVWCERSLSTEETHAVSSSGIQCNEHKVRFGDSRGREGNRKQEISTARIRPMRQATFWIMTASVKYNSYTWLSSWWSDIPRFGVPFPAMNLSFRNRVRAASVIACCVLSVGLLASCGRARGGTSGSRKMIIPGIDGLDPDLLTKFMAEGKMPNFARLAEQGSFRKLTTSIPPQSPVAWSNLITGMNAGGAWDL